MEGISLTLRQQVIRAAFASGAVEAVTRVLLVGLSVATARVFEPKEVGLLGLAVIIVGVSSLVASCGETACVTSRSMGADGQYAYVAVVVRGALTVILIGFTLFLFGEVAHVLVGVQTTELQLAGLVRVLVWQLVTELAGTYPRVLLQRRLELTGLACAGLVQVVGHVSVATVLLWARCGLEGLAWSAVVGSGMSTAFLWCRLGREQLVASVKHLGVGVWRQVAVATGRVLAGSVVGYLNGRLDNLLVAGVLGATAMSFYGMAWNASRLPLLLFGQARDVVLIPTLARMQDDTKLSERLLRESLRHYCVLLVFVCTVIFVSAPSLVAVVLGEKWLPLVPCLRVRSITVLVGPVLSACSALLIASGRAHLIAPATGAQLLLISIAIVPLAGRWGILGAAFGDFAAAAVLALGLFVVARIVAPQIRLEPMRALFVPAFAGVIAGFVAWGFGSQCSSELFRLACEIVVVLVGYPLVIGLSWERGRLTDLVLVLRAFGRARTVLSEPR